jgi:hypothetical protein
MSDKLIDVAAQVVEYVEQGDYMTALSYFESEARDVITGIDTHENQPLLDICKTQVGLIDEENWQQVLYNCEIMKEMLNG